jgi:DNA-binding protein YbaB
MLGAAVVEAVDAAAAARMDEWTRATQQPDDAGDGSDASGPEAADSSMGAGRFRSLRDPDVVESTRELYYLAMDAIARLGEVSRAMQQVTAEELRGRSPDGLVTVTVEGGRVVGVDLDQSWLRQAASEEISQRLRAAFSAVDQAGPRSAAAEALDHPSIRELREAGADPQQLLRRLGLT